MFREISYTVFTDTILSNTYRYSTGGWMILSCGKSMITDVFGTLSPEIVTASFATAFVSGLSAANLGGRMGWGAISDVMTSRRTMILFGLLGGPACCTLSSCCSSCAQEEKKITSKSQKQNTRYDSLLCTFCRFLGGFVRT